MEYKLIFFFVGSIRKIILNARFNQDCNVEMLHCINLQRHTETWGKNRRTEEIFIKLKRKSHPFPSKLCLGFSWSRTTGFSRPLVRWQAALIPRWPRRVSGPWVWIPMETGSSCSTCWRFMVMTPCWCQSSCAAAERPQMEESSKCCTTGFWNSVKLATPTLA